MREGYAKYRRLSSGLLILLFVLLPFVTYLVGKTVADFLSKSLLDTNSQVKTDEDVYFYEQSSSKLSDATSLQGLREGDWSIVEFKYSQKRDGSAQITNSLSNQVYQNKFSKEFVSVTKPPGAVYLQKESKLNAFLSKKVEYIGYKAYLSDQVISTPGRYVTDFDLSDDGKRIWLLEYKVVDTKKSDSQICFNCVVITADAYATSVNLENPLSVESIKLQAVEVLVDAKYPLLVENIESMDFTIPTVTSQDLSDPLYKDLNGNPLLYTRIDSSPLGNSFIYENINLYALDKQGELYILREGNIASINLSQPGVKYFWLNEKYVAVDTAVTTKTATNADSSLKIYDIEKLLVISKKLEGKLTQLFYESSGGFLFVVDKKDKSVVYEGDLALTQNKKVLSSKDARLPNDEIFIRSETDEGLIFKSGYNFYLLRYADATVSEIATDL